MRRTGHFLSLLRCAAGLTIVPSFAPSCLDQIDDDNFGQIGNTGTGGRADISPPVESTGGRKTGTGGSTGVSGDAGDRDSGSEPDSGAARDSGLEADSGQTSDGGLDEGTPCTPSCVGAACGSYDGCGGSCTT